VGKSNAIDDLRTLDPTLYENLMMIKYYDREAVEDLGLTMAIDQDVFGE